jgi:hypothetical protein
MRFLHGETLDAFSCELGVLSGRLAEWRAEAIAVMQAGLQSRELGHRDGFIRDLKTKVGEQTMQIALLERKIELLKAGGDSRAVSQSTSPSANKPYGVQRVCMMRRLSRATVQRRKSAAGARATGKRGPRTTLDDQAPLGEVRSILAASLFVGKSYRKVWARLRQQQGIRTSMRRVLRIMREHGLPAHQGSTIRSPQVRDHTIVADRMWDIDAIGRLADEGEATVVVDLCTGECPGVRAARRGPRS